MPTVMVTLVQISNISAITDRIWTIPDLCRPHFFDQTSFDPNIFWTQNACQLTLSREQGGGGGAEKLLKVLMFSKLNIVFLSLAFN